MPAAADAVAVITTPRRLLPTAGDTVEDPDAAATGVMPSVDSAKERASAAGVFTVVRTAAAGLREADATGRLTVLVARRVSVCGRLRAFGPALGEPALAELADEPPSALPVSA
ncbi:hypothetical protein [Mycolicibacterium vinylchloridicum]|uniref:hypothetical protein n=1 Tax=Mycolicibacterium vinylchloridicum TaxID=2736928 RepID=UPI0015CE653D|nr:hypothetical protein [Mycolicibacterium vinylchloridicum]